MSNYRYQPVLKHHGILGMKWGVRRFRNEDGSLTPLGKIRTKDDNAIRQAKTNIQSIAKESSGSAVYKQVRLNAAKKQLSDAKVLRQMHTHKKTNRQEKLEKKYLEKGLSQQDAEIAAYKRVRTEKALLAAGALTMAAATAYIARKHFREDVDKYINENTDLKRIAGDSSDKLHDAFYASYKKGDVKKYAGLYGAHVYNSHDGNAFQKTIGLTSGLKVAGGKTGKATLEELIKNDPEVAKEVKSMIYTTGVGSVSSKTRARSLVDKGKLNKKAYDAFNRGLVFHNPSAQKFYDALKNKGYDAVLDINDLKYSGYKAKSPVIVFNKSKVLGVTDHRRVDEKEINNYVRKFIVKKSVANATINVASLGAEGYAGYTLGKKATTAILNSNSQKKAVFRYKAQHPGTKLSDKEILDKIIKREE